MSTASTEKFSSNTLSSVELSRGYKEEEEEKAEISPATPTCPQDYPLREPDAAPINRPAQTEIKMNVFHEILFVGVVAVSHLMTQAAFAQALAPISIIAKSFPDLSKPAGGAWFISGYALTSGTFILISGRIGDIVGHQRIFTFGYTWFGIWSAFTGFAAYPGRSIFFVFCRAMQGIGPALLIPNALALLARTYPHGIKKNIMFSIFGFMAPAGFVIGATFGSLFAKVTWWPWTFWSFSFVCFALAAASLVVVPRALLEKPTNPPGFDWTGSITGVVGLVLVNVAFNDGPLYGWKTPHVYFILIIGVLFLVGFVWVETRARYPLLPLRTMNSTVTWMLGCVAFGWGCFGIWLFYSWRFLEEIRGFSPLMVSAQYGPAPIAGLFASLMTGFLITSTPISFVNLCSMLAFCAGIIIVGTMPVEQSYWAQMFVSIIVMPFGMDMSFPAATIVLSNHMPEEHQGLAASLVITTINYSISIALGVAGTVERNVVEDSMRHGSFAAVLTGFRSGFYTGMAYASVGVLLGTLFFLRTMIKDGWKVH